ncbi:MAG TPA: tetratricopeptide repeat protein [Bacteroides togonis]|nr:tetratricopeptide repeat protein [Bacteroides togonis]
MSYQKYIGLFFLLIAATTVDAQKAERDLIRKGNRMYNDSVYENAEVNYRKALEINPKSTVAMYNLANTLMQQNKLQEAMEQFASAAKVEKEKPNLAQIYHNMGVIFQSQKDYAKAIEAYKESLRNNPKDDETRYNLALAQKLLKDQQQDQQNQDNQQNQQKQEEKQDQQQNQQQNQNNDQQQEPPQQQKQDNQMSKENAEQLLNSVMQDEKDVQDKVKKQQQVIKGNRLEKDW